MELEKYIKKSKDLINDTYFYIQDALMKYHESLDNLKDSSWKYSKTLYEQEYQKIVDTYNQTTTKVVENCKALVQEQKNAYMEEVDEFYQSDGSKLDLNFMNLIKAEIPLTVKEVTDVIDKNKDNLTMLRVVDKYLFETNNRLPEQRRIMLDQEHNTLLHKSKRHGETEEKIFDRFTRLAMMGMIHPDKTFTLYQAHLDDYEEDAVLDLLKAKSFIDDETEERIKQIEEKQRKENNDKRQSMNPDWNHPIYS